MIRRTPTPGQLLGLAFLGLLLWRMLSAVPEPELLPAAGIELHVERVIDGDTLLMEGGYRVRLIGVDAPETKHPSLPPEPWGTEASEFARKLVEGKLVSLEFDRERRDDYGRWLAYVFVDETLLNEALVREGLATAELGFPYRSDRQRVFRDAEEFARLEHRGMWSQPTK